MCKLSRKIRLPSCKPHPDATARSLNSYIEVLIYIKFRYISRSETKHYIKTHDTIVYGSITNEQHNTTTQKPKHNLSVPYTSLRNLPQQPKNPTAKVNYRKSWAWILMLIKSYTTPICSSEVSVVVVWCNELLRSRISGRGSLCRQPFFLETAFAE